MIQLKVLEDNTKELQEKYKLHYEFEEKGEKKEKFNRWDNGVIAKFVLAERFSNLFMYKDYADYQNVNVIPESVFYNNNGTIKIYNIKTKLFEVLTDLKIEREIEKFFNNPNNLYIRKNCCIGVGDWEKYKLKMVEIIKSEINIFLKKNKLHWSNSFKKGYLGIVVENGTLFLYPETAKIEFKEEFDPNFLAEYRINLRWSEDFKEKIDYKNNHFLNFLKFKLEIDNEEKLKLLTVFFFDLFYTANPSQHIWFCTGIAESGKSTLLNWFTDLDYSEYWCSAKNLNNLMDKFIEDENIFSQNFILSDEVKDEYINDNARFKSLISKGIITTEKKFKDRKTIKPCAKLLAVGEKIPEIKQDGGIERRFCYTNVIQEKFKVPQEFLNLEEYLKVRKNEDFLELLILGMYAFSNGEYYKSKVKIKNDYDEIFKETAEEIAIKSISYINKLNNIIELRKGSWIEFSEFVTLFKILFPEEKGIKLATLEEWLRIATKKVEQIKGIKIFKHKTKNVKNEKGEIIFKQKVSYICNIGLKKDKIKLELLDKPNKIAGNNWDAQYNNIASFFKSQKDLDLDKLIEENS